ncbi:CHAP domain-containing protein [Sabulicella rubraurantiaca]|uniref:CHAP domain-containing protein n=1 Tax=Sabulicella rubraurantiaca TaxID=2811429 RepID=UPI001A9573CE|nr:CHAP domain-containing protein [Sabulicella rubraurantiaca]
MRLKAALLTMCLGIAGITAAPEAEAARSEARSQTGQARQAPQSRPSRAAPHNRASLQTTRGATRAVYSAGISCVPYARSVTGMDIFGNGREWWGNAAGRYARGQRPEPGSILSFPGTGGMPMGHVAVVSRVLHGRMIEIDHANWGGPGIRRGQVMRDIRVMDVSDDNSWTRVRVQVGWDSGTFGREYPTHGFIHNRPATTYAANEDMIRHVSYTRSETVRPASPTQRRPAARTQQRRR